MKLLLLIAFGFIFHLTPYAQSLSRMVGDAAATRSFKKAIEAIAEQPNRSFYKPSDNPYLATDVYADYFINYDNCLYIDANLSGELLSITMYKYIPDTKKFEVNKAYHSTQDLTQLKYSKFQHLAGDVYIEQEKSNDLSSEPEFVLYNPAKGVYFHYNYFYENGQKKIGGGFFKVTKSETISPDDVNDAREQFQRQIDTYQAAITSIENAKKQQIIEAILATKDEGVTSPFHKENSGKILFGNAVTEQNKLSPTTYKSKFTLDEAISASFFLDKGLSKYIDSTQDVVKENKNSRGESVFYIQVTTEKGKSIKKEVYIKNDGALSKTSGVFTLVLKKAQAGNNFWLHGLFPSTITDKAQTVKVELLTYDKTNTVIATGTYTYTPKSAAKMPNGYSCFPAKEATSKEVQALKPRLKEVAEYCMSRYNKTNSRNLKVVSVSPVSDWNYYQDEVGIKTAEIQVYIFCKDEKGVPCLVIDRYVSYDAGDTGIFSGITDSNINIISCDE